MSLKKGRDSSHQNDPKPVLERIVIVFVTENGLAMTKGKKLEPKKLFRIHRTYLQGEQIEPESE